MRWNRVARNVADAATPPPLGSTRRAQRTAHSAQRTTWTAEQLGRFLDFVADDRYLVPWIFLATTGCRRGERLGLRWSDLDLDRATAVISRQVTSIDHKIVVKDLPKTKRGHTVVLDSNTVEMLRRWRAQQYEEKLLVGVRYIDEGDVFCRPDGARTTPTASVGSSPASRSSTSGRTPTSRYRG
jgi:integrase